jgi:PAS domain S-box-containing protein
MSVHSKKSAKKLTSAGFFVRLLLVVFVMELTVMILLTGRLAGFGPIPASLVDALLVTLLCAPFFWFMVVRPMTGEYPAMGSARRSAPSGLFIKILTVVFLVEVLVNITIPFILPRADAISRYLADAWLTTALCAPLLWWFLSMEQRSHIDSLADLLGAPVKLFMLLLCAIFVIDLGEMPIVTLFSRSGNELSEKLADAFLTVLLIAPFLWWLVVRPLRNVALTEKARANAVQAQVVEAIVTIDARGRIDSFNPAAEVIFGYSAAEISGRPASLLFAKTEQSPEELLSRAAGSDNAVHITHEVSGKRQDGSTLYLDVSLSRILLGEEEHIMAIMRDISERKRAEMALRNSLSLLAATLESTADGILAVDSSGRMHNFNQKFLDMWRFPREIAELGDARMFLPLAKEQVQEPEAFVARMAEISGNPDNLLNIIRFRDGRVFECYCQPHLIEGMSVGRVWSFRDITSRTQMEEALRESEERFRQIFEQTDDAIFLFNPCMCEIIDVNPTAENLYGYSKQELKEGGLALFSRPDDLTRLNNAVCGVKQGKLAPLDNVVNLRKDGREIIVSVRGKIIPLQGEDTIYCTFRDISARIRLEEEARDMQAKLIQANKMTSLGLLVSGVAHEINNPNSFIMANSQLLAKVWEDAQKVLREHHREHGDFLIGGISFAEIDEKIPQLFKSIIEGARRINNIINNLKDFARQDRLVAERQVDLNRVATTAASLLLHQLNRYSDNFHFDLAEYLPRITGDYQQLEQVVINLLLNAGQSLPDKSRGIWITTGFDAAAGQATITVRDEGCGIARDVADRVMEPFFTTKLDSGGTGLGLAISLSIVKEHNGSLEFESEPGKGTTFVVKIPADESALQEHTK